MPRKNGKTTHSELYKNFLKKIEEDMHRRMKINVDDLMNSVNPLAAVASIDSGGYSFSQHERINKLEEKIMNLEYITNMSIDSLMQKLASGELKLQKQPAYPRVNLSTILGTKED